MTPTNMRPLMAENPSSGTALLYPSPKRANAACMSCSNSHTSRPRQISRHSRQPAHRPTPHHRQRPFNRGPSAPQSELRHRRHLVQSRPKDLTRSCLAAAARPPWATFTQRPLASNGPWLRRWSVLCLVTHQECQGFGFVCEDFDWDEHPVREFWKATK